MDNSAQLLKSSDLAAHGTTHAAETAFIPANEGGRNLTDSVQLSLPEPGFATSPVGRPIIVVPIGLDLIARDVVNDALFGRL